MRLLEIQDDGVTLTFTKYLSIDIPPYAILSHTWGDEEEEITFKDIKKGRGKDKDGYDKIRFCINRASVDGLRHLWIDTCCIDKSNNTELQQAINSMFRWYQNASKCYVYLSDVLSGPMWKSEFLKTKWITRGWTLQELLAPSSVEFFSSEGERLGDKKSLESLLHNMTGIAVDALQGTPLCEFNELERMSWIEQRQTRYAEDMAYALLGIFEVQMPLIYGEGKRNAFFRLRETIAKHSGRIEHLSALDRSMSTLSKVHLAVPFGRNADFVGREDILGELMRKIPPSTNQYSCQMTVIEGLGGVGKTQVALEAAYCLHEEHRDCSIFWVPAVDKTTFENAYRKIGQLMKIPGINENKSNVKALVKDALSEEDVGHWLLVIDNADDHDLMFGQMGENSLYEYLPFSSKGSILFTTRNHEVATSLDVGRDSIILIEAMGKGEAIQLLQKKLTETQLVDVESTEKLLDFLAYLPLAIRQASAYMMRTGISTTTYLGYCTASDADEIKILSQHFEDRSRYRYHATTNPIATTWLISFQHITNKYPLASKYLRFICYMAEKDIPTSLLPQFEDERDKHAAISVLRNYAFINARDESSSFDIHRLVRLAVRNWMTQEGKHQIEEVIQYLSNIYPPPSNENKTVWLQFLAHIDAALDFWMKEPHDGVGWQLLVKSGESHFILGKAQAAEVRYRQASEIGENMLGVDHPNTLASVNGLAITLRQQAKYVEAEQRQREILRSSINSLGIRHPDTLASMNGLAEVLRQQGKYHEAEQVHKRNVQLCSDALGTEHPNTLASLNNLAIVYYQQGRYQQAEKTCHQTIQAKIQVFGQKHPEIYASLNGLAIVLDQQGRYQESERQHRQNLQVATELLGAEHPETMAVATNLASVLYRQGRYKEAEREHRVAIEALTKELSIDHPDTLANTNGLAEVLRQQGRYEEAKQQHQQTHQLISKALGPEHPSTLAVMTNLAATLFQKGDYEEAAMYFQESLEVKIKVLGPEHPSTIVSMNGLANVHLQQGRHEQAEEQYIKILQLRQAILGPEHPFTLASLNNLGVLYYRQGRHAEAEEKHQQAFQLQLKVLGAGHPNTLSTLSCLVTVLRR